MNRAGAVAHDKHDAEQGEERNRFRCLALLQRSDDQSLGSDCQRSGANNAAAECD
jgi:hypothetical protein